MTLQGPTFRSNIADLSAKYQNIAFDAINYCEVDDDPNYQKLFAYSTTNPLRDIIANKFFFNKMLLGVNKDNRIVFELAQDDLYKDILLCPLTKYRLHLDTDLSMKRILDTAGQPSSKTRVYLREHAAIDIHGYDQDDYIIFYEKGDNLKIDISFIRNQTNEKGEPQTQVIFLSKSIDGNVKYAYRAFLNVNLDQNGTILNSDHVKPLHLRMDNKLLDSPVGIEIYREDDNSMRFGFYADHAIYGLESGENLTLYSATNSSNARNLSVNNKIIDGGRFSQPFLLKQNMTAPRNKPILFGTYFSHAIENVNDKALTLFSSRLIIETKDQSQFTIDAPNAKIDTIYSPEHQTYFTQYSFQNPKDLLDSKLTLLKNKKSTNTSASIYACVNTKAEGYFGIPHNLNIYKQNLGTLFK